MLAVMAETTLQTAWSRLQQLAEPVTSRSERIEYVLEHVDAPWLAPLGMTSGSAAREREQRLYRGGGPEESGGGADAFRHTYAAALMTARAQRLGVDAERAADLVVGAGDARERDTNALGYNPASGEMDRHNNRVGAQISLDAGPGIGERALARRVLEAMRSGQLTIMDEAAPDNLRQSTVDDLPERGLGRAPSHAR